MIKTAATLAVNSGIGQSFTLESRYTAAWGLARAVAQRACVGRSEPPEQVREG